jgi:hypothetical protein
VFIIFAATRTDDEQHRHGQRGNDATGPVERSPRQIRSLRRMSCIYHTPNNDARKDIGHPRPHQ